MGSVLKRGAHLPTLQTVLSPLWSPPAVQSNSVTSDAPGCQTPQGQASRGLAVVSVLPLSCPRPQGSRLSGWL